MKQLVVASTFYQCLSLAAAVDAGTAPLLDGERILVLANSSQVPELSTPLQEHTGFDRLASRFDRVVDLAELIYPRRPVQFSPRNDEIGMWQKLLRAVWKLGAEPVTLLMDSVQVNPALALAKIFRDAALYAHSDGLMTYSPTRKELPVYLGQRIAGLVYVDLVPGLRPRLLSEFETPQVLVPREAVRRIIEEISEPAGVAENGRSAALILGQYLADLGILTRAEEIEFQGSMLREAAGHGVDLCIFKPHPSSAPAAVLDLRRTAREIGVELEVDDGSENAELVMFRRRPSVVIGCFSTGLATARYIMDVPARAVGTGILLPQLAPYENSNRVPLVLSDALFTESSAPQSGPELQRLVDAVAYCMQPELMAPLAADAESFLAEMVERDPQLVFRYFKRRRLTALGLPGGLPPAPSEKLDPPATDWYHQVARSAQRLLRTTQRRSVSGAGGG